MAVRRAGPFWVGLGLALLCLELPRSGPIQMPSGHMDQMVWIKPREPVRGGLVRLRPVHGAKARYGKSGSGNKLDKLLADSGPSALSGN